MNKTLKLGMIGLDTSHCSAFADRLTTNKASKSGFASGEIPDYAMLLKKSSPSCKLGNRRSIWLRSVC